MYSVITTYVTNLKTVKEYAIITVILQRMLWNLTQINNLTFKAISEGVNYTIH